MPKVLYSPPSPYSAKVRMAARHAGVDLEDETIDTIAQPDRLTDNNPLGKIPTVLLDDGTAIFDSRVIMQWLNRESRNALYPRNAVKRLETERMEALTDGLCDVLLAQVYERRFRPEEMVHQPELDRQWAKAERVLDRLNDDLPGMSKRITAGHIALRAALGYLELRFPGKWQRGRTKLKRWPERFDRKFPELTAYLPQG